MVAVLLVLAFLPDRNYSLSSLASSFKSSWFSKFALVASICVRI
jgi:hypothetical protein